MTVKLVYRDKHYEVPAGMTVRDAIKKVGLQPETVLAVHRGKLMTDDTLLREDMQTIKLVAVISGGAAPRWGSELKYLKCEVHRWGGEGAQ